MRKGTRKLELIELVSRWTSKDLRTQSITDMDVDLLKKTAYDNEQQDRAMSSSGTTILSLFWRLPNAEKASGDNRLNLISMLAHYLQIQNPGYELPTHSMQKQGEAIHTYHL